MPRKGSTGRKATARQTHAQQVLAALVELYPSVICALDHQNAFELLVATVLSAQCTDARVNLVTPGLFAAYPDPATLANAVLADVEQLVYPTGFFRAKARNLVNLAAALVADHGGAVPPDLAALTALPGVGRKTAHVVLGNAFAIESGVVVDTHVKRLAFRLGLTEQTDPVLIEHELAALVPRDHWINLSHRLIAHGRAICTAIRPKCLECPLAMLCPRNGVETRAKRPTRTAKRLPNDIS